jgi:hypothetical protein
MWIVSVRLSLKASIGTWIVHVSEYQLDVARLKSSVAQHTGFGCADDDSSALLAVDSWGSQIEHKSQRLVNGLHLFWANHALAR